MVDAAEFVIRLVDKATAPARRVATAFAGIEKSLKPVTGSKAFKALDRAGDKLWDFGKTAGLVGLAIGVGVSGALTKASVDAAIFRENTELAFSRLTGSAEQGKKAFSVVTGLVSELGLDLHQTTEGFRELLAAQFSIEQATGLTKMVADLSIIGVKGEKAGRIMTALTQIKAKGKLQQEELLQVAEAGISLELVLGQLQKQFGKTLPEIQKMQQAGKISGEAGLQAIQAAVKQKLHIKEFGDARKEFVDKNLEGMIDALKAQGDLFFLKLGDSIKEAAVALKPLVEDTTAWVKNLDTASITAVVTSVLETLRKLVPLGREFFSGFLQGFGALAEGMKLDIDATSLQSAAAAGRSFAEALGTLLQLTKIAGQIFLFFTTTPLGKTIGAFTLVAIGVTKVVGGLVALSATITPVVTGIRGMMAAHAVAQAMTALSGATATATVGMWAFLAPVAAVAGAVTSLLIAWDQLQKLKAEMGGTFEGLFSGDFFGAIDERMNEQARAARAQADAMGQNMALGMADGMMAGIPNVEVAGANLGMSAISATQGAIDAHSPSREFERLGEFAGAGFGRGMENMAPVVESSSARALAAPALSGAGSGIGGGGATITVPVTVNVNGSASASETAQQVAIMLPDAIVQALERFANPSPTPAPA